MLGSGCVKVADSENGIVINNYIPAEYLDEVIIAMDECMEKLKSTDYFKAANIPEVHNDPVRETVFCLRVNVKHLKLVALYIKQGGGSIEDCYKNLLDEKN